MATVKSSSEAGIGAEVRGGLEVVGGTEVGGGAEVGEGLSLAQKDPLDPSNPQLEVGEAAAQNPQAGAMCNSAEAIAAPVGGQALPDEAEVAQVSVCLAGLAYLLPTAQLMSWHAYRASCLPNFRMLSGWSGR